jgi:hypothetical protein
LLGADDALRLRCVDAIFDPVVYEFPGGFRDGTGLLSLKGGSTRCLSGAEGLTSFSAIVLECTITNGAASLISARRVA